MNSPVSRPTGAESKSNAIARSPREALIANAANEIVFAVVGHAGSGTSTVATSLQALLSEPNFGYQAEILKARSVIQRWASAHSLEVPTEATPKLHGVELLQDAGDEMRKQTEDFSSVARALIGEIRATRARKMGIADPGDGPVNPDGKPRAYILDSIRHPAEVELLRHVYQDAFILIGIVCEEERREQRLTKKFPSSGIDNVRAFMERDAKHPNKHGQRVAEAFHLADFFLDNTVERFDRTGIESKHWEINEKLRRLIKIVSHSEIVRPETSETAMAHAADAAMRSACLSRQVGAALTDSRGNVVATGSNEVPRAGGGVYGESYEPEEEGRCALRRLPPGQKPFCSNTSEQNKLIDKLIEKIPELKGLDNPRKRELKGDLREVGIGDLIEFSRAVHAEMDALLSAAREGITTVGGRLYATTFPCHYCARHIVSAGVDEVQFIEPYPKSRAGGLHGDAIAHDWIDWVPPSQGGKKVLFRPFVGVAPRLYRRAFLKDRELKNKQTGELQMQPPSWGSTWHLRKAGYVEIEAMLLKDNAPA